MNGVHDMGGMQNMGPIEYQKNGPVFHSAWEDRCLALYMAVGPWRKWNVNAARYQGELIPPAEYLRMCPNERLLEGMIALLVKSGLVTRTEVESGTPAPGSPKAAPPLAAEMVPLMVALGNPSSRDFPAAPQFTAGQEVRARNIHPSGHTRLPRYARGKRGTVVRDRGVFVFPDTDAEFLGEKPQHLYSVRFAAPELWGEQASPRDTVYLDLWDDYLEPA